MMLQKNQIIVQAESEYFECIPCRRTFGKEMHLLQHCRQSSAHESGWCDRCEWLFADDVARTNHYDNSGAHWQCQFCNHDEEGADALARHQEDAHKYCIVCGFHFACRLQHRIKCHHMCNICQKEFDSQNNLTMVRRFTRESFASLANQFSLI